VKILTGLLVTLMLLGLVAGCQQTTTEVTYKEVSVGSMRIDIPTEWQRPENIEEILEGMKSGMGPEMEQYLHVDGYEAPGFSEDLGLFLMVMEMSKISESEGIAWEGWTSLLEAEGMTKEDFIPIIIAGFISEGAEEVTQRQVLQHTIHGCEVVEAQVACKFEGDPGIVNLLLVFAKNDLGVVVMLGEESTCKKYEDTWYEIRDSAKF